MVEFETCVKDGDKYFFFARYYNICVSCNVQFSDWKIVTYLPDEYFFSFQLCRKMVIWNNNIIFVPYEAKKIYILNLETYTWKVIELKPNLNKNETQKFIGAQLVDDKLWMFGSHYLAIVCLDLKTCNIEYYTDSIIECYEDIDMLFRSSGYRIDNKIYNPLAISNVLYIVDCDNKTIERKEIGSNENKYSGICFDGEKFWLSPRNDERITCVDKELIKVTEILLPKEEKWGRLTFSGAHRVGENIMFPSFSKKYKTIEIDSNKKVHIRDVAFYFVEYVSDNAVLAQCLDGELILIEGNVKSEYRVGITKGDIKAYISNKEEILQTAKKIMSERLIEENEVIDLEQYLKVIFYEGNLS